MKALLTGIFLLAVLSPAVSSQEKKETKTEPAHKMVQFHGGRIAVSKYAEGVC